MSVQAIAWALQRNVDPGPKILLIALANYANDHAKCFPSKARLAKDCNLSERSIRNYMVLLEEMGFLSVHPEFDDSGRQTTNTIVLNLDDVKLPKGEGANQGGVHSTPPPRVHLAAPLMNRQIEPSVQLDARAKDQQDSFELDAPSEQKPDPASKHFADFWQGYPKREGSADKKAALKAFQRAVKRAPPMEIIAGAARYAAHCDATQKTGTAFVRQARTWLNADGWTETYETGGQHGTSSPHQKPQQSRARQFIADYLNSD